MEGRRWSSVTVIAAALAGAAAIILIESQLARAQGVTSNPSGPYQIVAGGNGYAWRINTATGAVHICTHMQVLSCSPLQAAK